MAPSLNHARQSNPASPWMRVFVFLHALYERYGLWGNVHGLVFLQQQFMKFIRIPAIKVTNCKAFTIFVFMICVFFNYVVWQLLIQSMNNICCVFQAKLQASLREKDRYRIYVYNLLHYFFCAGVMYSCEYDVDACDVTLSAYIHTGQAWKYACYITPAQKKIMITRLHWYRRN
jgi:hypothetical protein